MRSAIWSGAGSFGFTRTLVKDILTFPAFSDAELVLMDIEDWLTLEKIDTSRGMEYAAYIYNIVINIRFVRDKACHVLRLGVWALYDLRVIPINCMV